MVKRYPSGIALDDFSLEVPTGCFMALVGPSGSGKTTALKMVNRLIEPDQGDLYLDERAVSSFDPVELRRQVGYVIQQIGLFPHLCVRDNVALVPRLKGWSPTQQKQRADALLQLVGLEPQEYGDRYPAELSGGQQQRVGVARALAADPQLLLMDEPFSALDPLSRRQLQTEFASLQRRLHKTVLFVTHDLDEALRLADRIAVVRAGRVVQEGTPKALIQEATDPFVREFLAAAAPIAQLEASIEPALEREEGK